MFCCDIEILSLQSESVYDVLRDGYSFLFRKTLRNCVCDYSVFELGLDSDSGFIVVGYLGRDKDEDPVFVNLSVLLSVFPSLSDSDFLASFVLRAHRSGGYDEFSAGSVLLRSFNGGVSFSVLSGYYELGYKGLGRRGDIFISISGGFSDLVYRGYFIATLSRGNYFYTERSEDIVLSFNSRGVHLDRLPGFEAESGYDRLERLDFIYGLGGSERYLLELLPSFYVRSDNCCDGLSFYRSERYDELNNLYELVITSNQELLDLPDLDIRFVSDKGIVHGGLIRDYGFSVYVDANEYGLNQIVGDLEISYFSPLEGVLRKENQLVELVSHLSNNLSYKPNLGVNSIHSIHKGNITLLLDWSGFAWGDVRLCVRRGCDLLYDETVFFGLDRITFPLGELERVIRYDYVLYYRINEDEYGVVGSFHLDLWSYYKDLRFLLSKSLGYNGVLLSYVPERKLLGETLYLDNGNVRCLTLEDKHFRLSVDRGVGLSAYLGFKELRLQL